MSAAAPTAEFAAAASPPHSAEMERAILGSIILDNHLVHEAAELLSPEDLYLHTHRHVFRAMLDLSARGREINPIFLGEELRRAGTLEQVGGLSFLSELSHGLPSVSRLKPYAAVVLDKAVLRRVASAAYRVHVAALEEADEPRALLDRLRESAAELDADCARADGGRASLLTSFAEFMETDFEDGEVIAFDARRGEIAFVQSVTNHGKSTVIRNSSLSLVTGRAFAPFVEAGEPRRVLLLNFEGSGDWFKSDLRTMTRDFAGPELERVLKNFMPTHAPVLDGEPLSLSRHMRALESAVRRAGGVDVLIIDTVSAAFSIRNENDNAEVANSVMKPLVKLARRINCLIVLVHHIGKAKSEEGATREQAHRGRGASAWADLSTSIFNLDADPHDQERVTVTCGKRKNGGNYERVLRLDRARRWLRATDEAPARAATNRDLMLEAIRGLGLREMRTADIVNSVAGKVPERTAKDWINKLVEQGELLRLRQGWYGLPEVCASCAAPYIGLHNCTTRVEGEKPLAEYELAGPSPNGNGFHAGGLAGEIEV